MDPRGITAARAKWGRFLPHQRANVDQVPLPFVNDMEARSCRASGEAYACARAVGVVAAAFALRARRRVAIALEQRLQLAADAPHGCTAGGDPLAEVSPLASRTR